MGMHGDDEIFYTKEEMEKAFAMVKQNIMTGDLYYIDSTPDKPKLEVVSNRKKQADNWCK